MKKFILILLTVTVTSAWCQVQLSQPPAGDNQKSRVTQFIGPVEVTINYSSPDVHGPTGEDRKGKIWGTLVPYAVADEKSVVKTMPWRAGANENTTISFSHDVTIEGKSLKAGTYGLFLLPVKDKAWTWIFSKNSTSWGSFSYQSTEDALRIDVTPVEAPYTEWLTYGFDNRLPSSAVAFLQWEEKRIPFKIEAATSEIYLAQIRNELRSTAGFDYRNWSLAAQLGAKFNIDLKEALMWADKAMSPSIGGQEDFNTLNAKAVVLYTGKQYPEAEAAMDKAITMPGAPVLAIHQYGRLLLQGGENDKALKVFQYNAKIHPEEKFVTNVGLARAYASVGEIKNAIEHWEVAIKNVPPNRKAELPLYEAELKKLKEAK